MTDAFIGILGPGAVGHMLAFYFNSVEGLGVQMRGRHGLLPAGQTVLAQNQAQNLRLDTKGPMAHLWFSCLKAHALSEGLKPLLSEADPGTQVIILSNGFVEPILQPLRRQFPNVILRKGLVTRGVKQTPEGGYSIGPQGQVIWGDDRQPTPLEQKILRSLSAQGFQYNVQCCRLRREKWYYNTCLNTLCGVRRLARNGLAAEGYREELEALHYEVIALAQELWPDWQPVPRELWQNLLRLIANTADNENSMATDVRLGRTTEASVLSGMVHRSHQPDAFPLLLAFDQKLQINDKEPESGH